MKFITTNKEVEETYQMVQYHENSLFGNLMYNHSNFNNAHNILDIRYAGLQDRKQKLKEKYFVIVNGNVQFDETPAEKEGEKATQTPRLNEGLNMDDYRNEMKELMETKIEISREQ